MSKDYYKILGVEKNATADEIKKAFRKLAMQHHPDRQGGNEAKFKEINEAYQVLSDADKRTKYDQFGSDFESQGGFGNGMGWEDFMRAARGQQGAGGFEFNFGDGGGFGDMFGDLFGFGGGGSRRQGRKSRGRDIQVDVEVSFQEAAFGIEKEISLRKQSRCDVCSGTGAEPGSKVDTCGQCHGQGQVVQIQRTFLGNMQTVTTCPTCNGRGQRPSKSCKHCGGDGVLAKTMTVKVKIPPGIDEGQSIRLSGYGETAPHGGEDGDLFVRVHIRQQKLWHREGFDVYTDQEISFPQAVLGDQVEVETIDGVVKVVIPEGTESGQLIRLRGHGITHLGRSNRGDHYVRVKIRVPKKLNRSVRKVLEDLKKEI
ncbi:MAG TPA: molecular chaperone DnaJ [Candidatus Magasanikbacteria bacterium]|nr:molecular chaperone DnaJ [Candidatus Magasanikbacteria bacterium]